MKLKKHMVQIVAVLLAVLMCSTLTVYAAPGDGSGKAASEEIVLQEENAEPADAAEPEQSVDNGIVLQEESTPLELDTDTEVSVVEGESPKIYSFTPAESGPYALYSFDFGNVDPYLYVYDENFNQIYEDDDGAGVPNFLFQNDLEAGKTYYFGFDSNGSSDTGTYYVRIEKAVIRTIEFDANGGYFDAYNEETGEYFEAQTWTENLFEKGYLVLNEPYKDNSDDQFLGWSAAPDAEYPEYNNQTIVEDIPVDKLYAVWGSYITITFDPTDGYLEDDPDVDNIIPGTKFDPTWRNAYINKAGITFAGWYDEAEGGTLYDENTILTDDVTLFAHWNGPQDLILGETTDVEGRDDGEALYYHFVPQETGVYKLQSFDANEADPNVTLYEGVDSEDDFLGNILGSSNAGEDHNFKLSCALKKDQDYFYVLHTQEANHFSIRIEKEEVLTLTENTDTTVTTEDSSHYYSFTAQQDGLYQVTLTPTHEMDARIDMRDDTFNQKAAYSSYLEEEDGGFQTLSVSAELKKDETVYIRFTNLEEVDDIFGNLDFDVSVYVEKLPTTLVTFHANEAKNPGAYYEGEYNYETGEYEHLQQIEKLLTSDSYDLWNYLPNNSNQDMSFAGWSVNPDAEEPDDELTITGESMDLYAVWKQSYDITFVLNAENKELTYFEEYDPDAEEYVKRDSTTIKAQDGERINSIAPGIYDEDDSINFAGWALTPEAAEPDNNLTVTGEMTLYAVWKHIRTVTFDANGGYFEIYEWDEEAEEEVLVKKDTQSCFITEGDNMSFPDDPKNDDPFAVFKGWFDQKEGGEKYDFGSIADQDITLYAQWEITTPAVVEENAIETSASEYDKNIYEFTPDEDGIYIIATASPVAIYPTGILYNDQMEELDSVNDKEEMDLNFVVSLEKGKKYYIAIENTHGAAYSLLIKKADEATVTYDVNREGAYIVTPEGNASTYEMQAAIGHENPFKGEPVSEDGAIFTGWSDDKDAATGYYSFVVRKDTTYYAIWKDPVRVIFHANNEKAYFRDSTDDFHATFYELATGEGSAFNDEEVFDEIQLTNSDPYLNHVGWSTDPNAEQPMKNIVFSKETKDLYAVWVSVAPDMEQAETLEPGVKKEARAEFGCKTFKFTPDKSGIYVFASSDNSQSFDCDAYGRLFDSEGEMLDEDDDASGSRNFRIEYELEAGKTYYLVASAYTVSNPLLYNVCVDALTTTEVTFDAGDNGTFDNMPGKPHTITEEYTVGTAIYLGSPTDPKRPVSSDPSKAFAGWSTVPDAEEGETYITVTEDLHLYAVWKEAVQVTFHVNRTDDLAWIPGEGGAKLQEYQAVFPIGAQIGFQTYGPKTDSKDLAFAGWAANADATEADMEIYAENGMDLYALWVENTDVIFDLNTDAAYYDVYDYEAETYIHSRTKTVKEKLGEVITDFPEQDGGNELMNILGWSVNKDAAQPDAEIVAEKGMTVYAVWEKRAVITTLSNGGFFDNKHIIAAYAFKKGSKISLDNFLGTPEHPDVLNRFEGWADAPENGTLFKDPYEVSEDTVMYAQWKHLVVEPIGLDETKSVSGVDLFKFVPEEDGTYSFSSTDSTSDPCGYIYNDRLFVLAENDDDGITQNFKVNAPMKAGRTYYLGAADDPDCNVIVRKETPAKVTFVPNIEGAFYYDDHGNRVDTLVIDSAVGATITSYVVPGMDNTAFEFRGWSKNPDATEADEQLLVDSPDVTFYGIWKEIVLLTYDANGGYFWDDPEEVCYIQKMEKGTHFPDNNDIPSRDDYTFAGWFDAPEGGNKIDSSFVLNENKTVYAQWTAGHDIRKVDAKEATCTKPGNSEYWYCETCDKYYADENESTELTDESWIIPAKGHTPVVIKGTPATCEEDGLTDGIKCSVCKEILEEQAVIKATGHNWIYKKGSKVSPVWEWTGDDANGYTAATAHIVCEYDSSHKHDVTAEVSSHEQETDGRKELVYTAKAVFEGTDYVDSKTVPYGAPTKLTLNETNIQVPATKTYALKVTATPSGALIDSTVKWSSSDPELATVDENTGVVTGKKYGKVKITAVSVADGSVKATCNVQVRLWDALYDAAAPKDKTKTNVSKEMFDAIYWAVDHKVTGETVKFGTNNTMTRGQFVRFLYRYAGNPKVSKSMIKKYGSQFKDVDKNYTHYNAIVWAVSKGLIAGYSDGTFKPEKTLTRNNVATILWKFAGQPKVKNVKKPFTDVAKSAALAWGKSKKVFTGTKFYPNKNCLRGDFAVFLYRYDKNVK